MGQGPKPKPISKQNMSKKVHRIRECTRTKTYNSINQSSGKNSQLTKTNSLRSEIRNDLPHILPTTTTTKKQALLFNSRTVTKVFLPILQLTSWANYASHRVKL